MEAVSLFKNWIVVRTATVTLNNIISNVLFLRMLGVAYEDIVKDGQQAVNYFYRYQKDKAKLDDLELKRKIESYKDTKKIDSDIAIIKNRIANNPVLKLIEEGVMQTIIEDVTVDETGYTYKDQLGKFTEKHTKWMNPLIKDGLKVAFVAEGTTLYNVLDNAVKMSDFVGRYILYKHYTQKKQMESPKAIRKVVDLFINYDLPTHKYNQYMNDVGLFWFSKYFLRIQKIIAQVVKDNPQNVLNVLLAQMLIGNQPTILNSTMLDYSNWLSPLGTPLSGAGAFDDIITVRAATSLF